MIEFRKWGYIITILLITALIALPLQALGSVRPIEEQEQKLAEVSAEQKEVLKKLFLVVQEIDELKRTEEQITIDTDNLQQEIIKLQEVISNKQQDFDFQLEILENVLVNYQRGGLGSYLEIFFKSDNLSQFLKSLNVLKDLTRNVGTLLYDLDEGQNLLLAEKASLDENVKLLEAKKLELSANLHKNQLLQQEQEQYLASLQEEMDFYQEQLTNLNDMWADSKELFVDLLADFKQIIETNLFVLEDSYFNFNFFSMQGSVAEQTFNSIIQEHAKYTNTVFRFKQDMAVLEVPDKQLVLNGTFVIVGDNKIEYRVTSGSFYGMPLDQSSIKELFKQGPLLIDYNALVDEFVVDFTITDIKVQKDNLIFQVRPNF
jgi:peptidoglycan hydrolase CwlO-like protein